MGERAGQGVIYGEALARRFEEVISELTLMQQEIRATPLNEREENWNKTYDEITAVIADARMKASLARCKSAPIA
jgi:hypothetical protein